jgi:hypothetical protein
MKSLICCALLLVFPGIQIHLWAQPPNHIQIGTAYKQPSKQQFQGILGEDSSFIYSVEAEFGFRKLKTIYLSTFEQTTLHKVHNEPVELNALGTTSWTPVELFVMDNRIFVLAHSTQEESTQIWGWFRVNQLGKTLQFEEITRIPTSRASSLTPHVLADDSTSLIHFFFPLQSGTPSRQKWLIQQWNTHLEKRVDREIALPYSDRVFEATEFLVHPQGELGILCKQVQGIPIESELQLKVNNKYFLVLIEPVNHHILELEIALQDKWLRDAHLAVDSSKWYVAGFYGNSQESSSDGIYALRFSASGDLEKAGFNPFSGHKSNAFTDNAFTKGQWTGLTLTTRNNQELILVGEKQFKEITPRYDSRQDLTAFNDVYYFDEAAVFVLSNEGIIARTHVLPKYQTSVNDQGAYSSVFTVVNESGSIFVLFNDHKGNRGKNSSEYKSLKRMTAYQKSYLATWEIQEDGSVVRDELFPGDFKGIFKPVGALQVSPRTFYFIAEQSSLHRLVKISR